MIIPVHLKLVTTFESLILKAIIEMLLLMRVKVVTISIARSTPIFLRNILANPVLFCRVEAIISAVDALSSLEAGVFSFNIE